MLNREQQLEVARATSQRESESDTFKKLTMEEKETHYFTTDVDKEWFAESSIPKDIHRFEKCNWTLVDTTNYPDGTVMKKRFKAPRNCLTPRTYVVDKPKRERPPMTEEHKAKLFAARNNKKSEKVNSED
jgi:hypothetical protein